MNHYLYRFNDEMTLCGTHVDPGKDLRVVDMEITTCPECLRLLEERREIKMKEAGVKN